jgi:hypothetical protein
MGTVDRRLLGHWEAERWRRHERGQTEEELERVVVDARRYIERRRAALEAMRPTPPAPAI